MELANARAAAGPPFDPAYWTKEPENIDHMVEASPLIIRKLRHHSFHLTGIRVISHQGQRGSRFEARLARCASSARRPCVGSRRPLGGFG